MLGFISKLFGGSKSEKDVKKILPQIAKVREFFATYQSLSNDELRGKTVEFKARIKTHLTSIDDIISEKNNAAEALSPEDISGRDVLYREIDELKKKRDQKIEEVLLEI